MVVLVGDPEATVVFHLVAHGLQPLAHGKGWWLLIGEVLLTTVSFALLPCRDPDPVLPAGGPGRRRGDRGCLHPAAVRGAVARGLRCIHLPLTR